MESNPADAKGVRRSYDDRVMLASFAVLFGLLTAVLSNYRYGLSDQAEQLPAVFRIMDPSYLANDFFVNAAAEFGPRFYYSHTLALLANFVPLPAVVAVLWLSAFVGVAVVTAFMARELSGSVLGGMVAVVLITLPEPFDLGSSASVLYDSLLVPRALAMPFALFALWKGVRGQPARAAIASIPAILFQPVMGLEVAGLALVAAGANRVFLLKRRGEYGHGRLWTLAVGVFIIGLTSLIWIVPMISTGAGTSLEPDEFVHIYGYFRHPHHLTPSAWDTTEWVLGAAFIASVVIALLEMFRTGHASADDQNEHMAMGVAVSAIFGLMAGALLVGYVFVEIVPTRIATTAQTFRMVIFAAWLGWILMAGVAARLLVMGLYQWAALFVASAVSVPTLFAYKVTTFIASMLKRGALMRSAVFFICVAVLAVVTLEITRRAAFDLPRIPNLLFTAFGLTVVLAIAIHRRFAPAALVTLSVALFLSVATLALDRNSIFPSNIPNVSAYIASRQPIFTLDEAKDRYRHDYMVELAEVARDNTDPDSVFLVPWNWPVWRLFSERAIVVDHKAFPFRDEGMKEWYERYLAIYDEGAGYPDDITESELLELRQKYGFDYAVIRSSHRMPSFPVLKSSGGWKLVRVADSG